MTFRQELNSFWVPQAKPTQPPPAVGSKAPSSDRLHLPNPDGRPTIITFLRHCGCPCVTGTVAAKPTSRRKDIQSPPRHGRTHPRHLLRRGIAQRRKRDCPLGRRRRRRRVEILVDADRDIFALWGLGFVSRAFLSPSGLWAVYRLGKDEGIWNRDTESGNRWQTSGSFAVDGEGMVRWGGPMQRAHEIPNFEEAVKILKAGE
ncbi:hypothetical protein B0H12DRAFT_1225574 [Mycena haematopus]|nr:hypothetical protein B0H12DRAFT_1225574 [Mycena haematopus]